MSKYQCSLEHHASKDTPAKIRAVLGQLTDMDLRLLRVFKSVVECGGMAAAELELNIGTSTVSRHVKDLETRLGLVLCRRGRAGFALTAEGQQIYDETLRLLAGPTPSATAWTRSTAAWAGSCTWRCSTRPPPTRRRSSAHAIALFSHAGAGGGAEPARGLAQRHRARRDRRPLPGRRDPGPPQLETWPTTTCSARR
jgi:hypothetical protein